MLRVLSALFMAASRESFDVAAESYRDDLLNIYERQISESAVAGWRDATSDPALRPDTPTQIAKLALPGDSKVTDESFRIIAESHAAAVQRTSTLITQMTVSQQETIRNLVSFGYRWDTESGIPDTTRQLAVRIADELPSTGRLGGLDAPRANSLSKQTIGYLSQQLANGIPEVRARQMTERFAARLHQRLIRARALTIARTEVMTASNIGRMVGVREAVNQRLTSSESRKRWSATGGERMCPTCGRLHGQIVGLNEMWEGTYEPPAHPRCRCTFVLLPPTAEARAREAAERAKRREAKRRAAAEAKRRADLLAGFAARLRAAERAKRRAAEQAKRRAEEEAKRRAREAAAEEAKRRAAEEAKRRAAARARAAEEAKRQADAQAERMAAREAARREHAARMRARREAIEAKRRAEEEARRQALEEAKRRAAQQAADPRVAEAANWRAQDHPKLKRIAAWRGENTPGGLNRLAGVLRKQGINPKAANLAKRRKPLRAADRDLFGHQLADTLEQLAERYPDAYKSLKEIELLRSNSRAAADASTSMMHLGQKTAARFEAARAAMQRRILIAATRPDDALWARIRINPNSDMWQFRTGRRRSGELQSGTRTGGKGIHGVQYRFGDDSPVSEIQAAITHEFGHVRSFNAFAQWYVEDGRKALKRGDTRLAKQRPDFDSWTDHAEQHVNEMLEQAIKRGEIDPPPEFTRDNLKDLNKYLKNYRQRQRRSPKDVPLWQRYAWGDVSQYGSMNIHEFMAETALDVGVFGRKAAKVSRFVQRQVDEAQRRFTAELRSGENQLSGS